MSVRSVFAEVPLLTLLCALAFANPIFVAEIPDVQTFDAYSRTVDADEVAKFLIDTQSGESRGSLAQSSTDTMRTIPKKSQTLSWAI